MKRFLMGICIILICYFFLPLHAATSSQRENPSLLKAETFRGLTFRNIGPALTSGRISDIAIHPLLRGTWYVAVGSGGVWKTENNGTTWTPIFDKQSSYSIGCIAIDPVNPDIIWIGTGENVSGRHVGFGDGVYKSLNGGKTWKNTGLTGSEHIARILINPEDTDIVFVASEGPLWSSGGERGLYKTIDGGKTWQLILHISKDTGITSVEMEPGAPDILYAAAYQRRRNVAAFQGGGPESGIHKSMDGGNTWRKLTVGLPKGHIGKIGLDVSPIKPEVIYATVEAGEKEKGFYRSTDRGESWEKRCSYISGGTGPHYYQEIFADPHVFDRIYQMDVWMHVSEDGGKTFQRIKEKYKHSDNHALAFDMIGHNPDYLLAGCDGGVYETWDRGKNWRFISNLPVTQIYKLDVDNTLPFYHIHGGTQDNGSQLGPSRTMNINGIMNSDWIMTLGADGYATAIDPQDPDTIYVEWQQGHPLRYNKKSGQVIDIQPKIKPGEPIDRWNWDSPICISPHHHTRIYYASQRIYRSENRGDTWKPISPDLTRGIFRYNQEIMGRKWSVDDLWDHGAMSYYGTLTSISESPLKEGLIYTGSDDGLIHVTEDNGKNWRKIEKLPGVPDYFFVNDIKASPHDINTVFAAVDNHKKGDFKPYLLKSIDAGKTWGSITGDLPPRHLAWAIEQDHVNPDLLFIGTEFGIFFTLDSGDRWIKFEGNMPTISFRDIQIQRRENDLIGASFGRGFFVLDDYTPLRHLQASVLEKEALLFPVKKAWLFSMKTPLEMEGKAFMGDSLYIAPNPPFGATFTYYLKETLKSAKEQRRQKETEAEKALKDISFPGWETLKKEKLEPKPHIQLTITDQDGHIIRRLTGPVSAGLHRINWDLRYPSIAPTILEIPKDSDPWQLPPKGPMTIPGTYTVGLAKIVDGKMTPLSQPQTFHVEALGMEQLSVEQREEFLAFQVKTSRILRAMMGARNVIQESLLHLKYIIKVLPDTPRAEPTWLLQALELERKLKECLYTLTGDPIRGSLHEPAPPSMMQRVSGDYYSSSAATGTMKQDYELVSGQFSDYLETLRQLIEKDLKELESKLESVGAPWTPGRGVPRWNDR